MYFFKYPIDIRIVSRIIVDIKKEGGKKEELVNRGCPLSSTVLHV